MNKYLIAFLFLYSTSVFGAQKTEEQVIQKVNQIIQATHSSKMREVWPGFDMTLSPTAIGFGNEHVYTFNLSSSNPVWQQKQIDGTDLLFSPQDPWNLTKTPFQAKFPLDGSTAYVFNMDQAQAGARKPFHIFVHERFHSYQFEHFNTHREQGHYQDQLNVENLALVQLEEAALGDFLKGAGRCQKGIPPRLFSDRDGAPPIHRFRICPMGRPPAKDGRDG